MYSLNFKVILENASPHFVLGYILQEAHQVIERYGNNEISTVFPDWNISSPGLLVSFIGKYSVLEKILKKPYFQDMIDMHLLAYSLENIAIDGLQKIRFVKNQKITGQTPKAIQRKVKRIIKRQIERGEIKHPWEYKPREDQQIKKSLDIFFHIIYLQSTSTDQIMPLCIQAEYIYNFTDTETVLINFDSYGLSTLFEHRGITVLPTPFF